jgi:ribosomal protein S18 acetylase RimI-like enzyme
VQLIPATGAHTDAIAGVHVRSWQAAYAGVVSQAFLDGMSVADRARRWQYLLEKNESRTVVALEGQDVLGFVSFGRCRDEGAPADQGEIWALYADPTAWGQGIGYALTADAIHMLRAEGHADVVLWVLSQNHRGIRFYKRFGFVDVAGSERVFELAGDRLVETCMVFRADTRPSRG